MSLLKSKHEKPNMTTMQPVIQINQEDNKWDIRHKVWDYIENNNLANFPRPVHNRIPNFKDATHACNRLTDLHKFRSSRVVKVNPDRPQEQSRFITLCGALEACSVLSHLEAFTKTTAVKVDPDKPLEGVRLAALQARKTLLVPTPRLKAGLFNKIVPPKGATKQVLHVCSTSQGIKEFSVPVGLEDSVQVNLVVVGSVAVSENGYRVGKGEGFADMEYAMMACMGAVCDSTVIVTIVHDCQVMDIPEKLIEDHDLTVDFILTPTRIIQTECKRPKPQGIIWSKLDIEVLTKIPILKKLRLLEQKAGKDVTLKTPPAGEYENNNLQEACQSKIQLELKPNCDPKSKQQQQGHLTSEDDKHARFKDKFHICPSSTICLGDIPARLRVSELKSLLKEQEAVPMRINWQGAQHRAFLHYADSAGAEQALQALTNLTVHGNTLRAEYAQSQNTKEKEGIKIKGVQGVSNN